MKKSILNADSCRILARALIMLYQAKDLMSGLQTLFIPVVAALALLSFSSDVVADSICRVSGCSEMTPGTTHQDEPDGCGHCMCATHNGALVVPGASEGPAPRLDVAFAVRLADSHPPETLPVPIDHPPQLS